MSSKRKRELAHEVALLRVLNHKNIVRFLQCVAQADGEIMVFVMEYCGGGSLAQVVKRFGVLPEPLLAIYLDQVLSGLAYLHSEGVIHRDIKGGNILLTKDGQVKLADFGIATRLSDPSGTRSVVGTPYWMAPEVIEMKSPTTAADIWSLGCTVLELVSGKPPFYEFGPIPAMFKMVGEAHPPFPGPSAASPLLIKFLKACFVKDPPLRATARELCSHPWLTSCRAAAASKADISEMHQTLAHISALTEAERASIAAAKGPLAHEASPSVYNSVVDGDATLDMLNDNGGVESYPVPAILADPELLQKSMAHSVRITRTRPGPDDGGSTGDDPPPGSSMTLTIFECLKRLAESHAKVAALESYVAELESVIAARERDLELQHLHYEDAMMLARAEASVSPPAAAPEAAETLGDADELRFLRSRVARLEASLRRAVDKGVGYESTICELTRERDALRKEVGTLSYERQNMLSEVSSLQSAFRASPLLRDRVMRRLSVDAAGSSPPPASALLGSGSSSDLPLAVSSGGLSGATMRRQTSTGPAVDGGRRGGSPSPPASSSSAGNSPLAGDHDHDAEPYHWQVGIGEHSILPKDTPAEPLWKRKLVERLQVARARARGGPDRSPRGHVLDRFPPGVLAPSAPAPPEPLPAQAPKTRDQISSDFLSKLRFFREGEAEARDATTS
ncbi:STE/STE11/CDC15 protein kinase [Thecamonas trahens ATCC 50062]|uniref:STE/STE11/CDC15 protein kinase n=1 Tax=Thecamonas trahens ATCC 50062 TaxID=461836 RepID=A0A0L0DT16_THETB|nr:STE/STE11/CDC15 protein kinase [Thecamonas trahens ATCC 50062]KNC55415.1 STE/STE11/CDC15 protein kinase [Thecamonas trahens ATCC 50062]|eukprot:XP_013752954.1 STE/STE11/CDC15 protein kinase [Thecamonas trahens ATCC 50062]